MPSEEPNRKSWLKTLPETEHIKIVLVSSKTRSEDRFWGIKQGADDYITKPFSGTDLVKRVRRLLQPGGVGGGLAALADGVGAQSTVEPGEVQRREAVVKG